MLSAFGGHSNITVILLLGGAQVDQVQTQTQTRGLNLCV